MTDELVDHDHVLEYDALEHRWYCLRCPAFLDAEYMPVIVEQVLT